MEGQVERDLGSLGCQRPFDAEAGARKATCCHLLTHPLIVNIGKAGPDRHKEQQGDQASPHRGRGARPEELSCYSSKYTRSELKAGCPDGRLSACWAWRDAVSHVTHMN